MIPGTVLCCAVWRGAGVRVVHTFWSKCEANRYVHMYHPQSAGYNFLQYSNVLS